MNKKERPKEKAHYTGTAPSGFPPGICWLPRRRGRGKMCTEEAPCSDSRCRQPPSASMHVKTVTFILKPSSSPFISGNVCQLGIQLRGRKINQEGEENV